MNKQAIEKRTKKLIVKTDDDWPRIYRFERLYGLPNLTSKKARIERFYSISMAKPEKKQTIIESYR